MVHTTRQLTIVLLGLVLVCGGLATAPHRVSASTVTTVESFYPELDIPGVFEGKQDADSTLLGRYVQAIFIYFIWVVGIIATVMVVYGGIKWVSAAGNPGQIKDARDIIDNAVIGVIVALTSVVLLNIINPKLTSFALPSFTKINKALGGSASHVCTSAELSALLAKKESSSCGTFHTLPTKIRVDAKTGLPSSSGQEVYDVCVAAGCSDGSGACVLRQDTSKQVFLAGGSCMTKIPLQQQTGDRYRSLTEVTTHDTIRQPNDYTMHPCGLIVGTTGAFVGTGCVGNGGQCYVASTPVSLTTGTPDRVTQFACPKS
jgi:hypothetical protein